MRAAFGLALLGWTLLTGCQDDKPAKEGTDTGTTGGVAVAYPTLAGDVGLLMATRCEGCHNATLTEGGLDLQTDVLAVTVGVASTQALEMQLIARRDHLQSYLWHKVNGTHGVAGGSGSSMPLGGALAAEEVELLAHWIDIGCP